ncbi:MAG: isoprenylcysteine carboxylmethyltransferase family protein [Planctomycetia bacterium]|nr:isoprenylcysteine carboxylmethyltransferase family protein [Planctomycetia bacterium]
MPDENPYRFAMTAMFVAAIAIAGYRRVQAARAGGHVSHAQEGRLMFFSLRAAGLAAWGGVIVYLVNPAWMAWASIPLSSAVRWAGAVAAVVCLGLLAWTLAHLGHNLTDTVATRREHTLVTSGPYRIVRHPFYVSAALLFAAATLLTANWFIGLAGLAAMVLLVLRTSNEEARLHDRFGEAYEEYQRRTGRFMPRLRRR